MNEPAQIPQSEAEGVAAQATTAGSDPVRRLTLIVAAVVAALLLWYVTADRLAPWTDQARVHAYVVPISPKVAGRVTRVAVSQDQLVKAGDLLFELDPRDYRLALAQAEAALELAGQEVGASTDEVSVAEAKLAEARTALAFVEKQARRYLELAQKGTVSKADADRARAERDAAQSRVESAVSELERAKQKMGAEGNDNARLRDALADLDQARINLQETRIVAPADGGITNLTLEIGAYANAGQPVMAFVSFSDVWVQANLRENSIGNVDPGDPVDIVLDSAPGRVFTGEVVTRGFAVKQPSDGKPGEPITIRESSGWLRDAQRFPVRIRFTDDRALGHGYLLAGGQADVQIYAGDSWILNALGWIWIRLLSLLSFVY